MKKLLFLTLLVISTTISYASAGITRYVSSGPIGTGSGASAEDAADFLSSTFWTEVQSLLKSQPVTVKFLSGEYSRAYTEKSLVFSAMGHVRNTLLLEGDSDTPVFTVPTGVTGQAIMIDFRNCQNIVFRNFKFTGNGSVNYVLRVASTTGKACKNISIEDCTWEDMRGIVYGASGCHYVGTYNITYKNCTFKRIGLNSSSHMIYNAYDSHHVSIVDSHFEDCTGDYIRFRDNCDYGVVKGTVFKRNAAFGDFNFISIPLFNDTDPGDEIFGTHYSFTGNTFTNATNAVLYYSSGFDPEGKNYLLTTAEGAILSGNDAAAKKSLLLNNFGIKTDEIRLYNNTYSSITYPIRLGSFASYGAVSKGWQGYADISNVIGGTDAQLAWEVPAIETAPGTWNNGSIAWVYDLGTGTGSGAAAHTAGSSISTKAVPGFLPYPPSGNGRVGVPTSGAKFTIQDASLKISSSGSGNPAKFSAYNIPDATPVTSVFFTIAFNDATTTRSVWTVAMGNNSATGSANIFTSGSALTATGSTSNPEVFNAFRWEISSTAPSEVSFQYRQKPAATGSASYKEVTRSFFDRGGIYNMEVYCNNDVKDQTYTRVGKLYIVSPGTYHIWANGEQILNGTAAGFPANQLARGTSVNAFMLCGTNSGSPGESGIVDDNSAEAIINNIRLDLSYTTLPVNLVSFSARNVAEQIELKWSTASEQNNSHFEILRSADKAAFSSIGKVTGSGNSSQPQSYTFIDEHPLPGVNYYRLRQVDYDGKASISDKIVTASSDLMPSGFSVYSPAENQIQASIYFATTGSAAIRIIDLKGNALLSQNIRLNKGQNQIHLTVPGMQSGVFVAVLNASGQVQSTKFFRY